MAVEHLREPVELVQAEVDQLRLEKVDSVVSSVKGLVNNLVDRGRVEISLIGISSVPAP